MVKPEEAIAVFDKMLKRYAWAEDNKSVQAIKIAKECIEKQMPKKPDFECDGYDENGFIILDTWICPCCEEWYETDYDVHKHCPNCGQAIEWSDAE